MVSAIMLSVALIANVYYKVGYRVLVCLVVILGTAVHTHFFYNEVSFSYYGTAAIANLSVILFLSMWTRSPLSTAIQIISVVGIGVNFIGYIMYEGGLSPVLYNAIMLVLMVVEFLRLIIRTKNDRFHDVCEDDRLHHGLSVNDNLSNPTNTSRQK